MDTNPSMESSRVGLHESEWMSNEINAFNQTQTIVKNKLYSMKEDYEQV